MITVQFSCFFQRNFFAADVAFNFFFGTILGVSVTGAAADSYQHPIAFVQHPAAFGRKILLRSIGMVQLNIRLSAVLSARYPFRRVFKPVGVYCHIYIVFQNFVFPIRAQPASVSAGSAAVAAQIVPGNAEIFLLDF